MCFLSTVNIWLGKRYKKKSIIILPKKEKGLSEYNVLTGKYNKGGG
jgi:hypothetical protein